MILFCVLALFLGICQGEKTEVVDIKFMYECMCSGSKYAYIHKIKPMVQQLNDHIFLHTYPYGNGKTIIDEENVTIRCQHGPRECYGNRLHACAIDVHLNPSNHVILNSCMMEYNKTKGSDNEALEACGKTLNIDPEPIKECAQSKRGFELLRMYGENTRKLRVRRVPYILVNGVGYNEKKTPDLLKFVCDSFINPPPACHSEKLA